MIVDHEDILCLILGQLSVYDVDAFVLCFTTSCSLARRLKRYRMSPSWAVRHLVSSPEELFAFLDMSDGLMIGSRAVGYFQPGADDENSSYDFVVSLEPCVYPTHDGRIYALLEKAPSFSYHEESSCQWGMRVCAFLGGCPLLQYFTREGVTWEPAARVGFEEELLSVRQGTVIVVEGKLVRRGKDRLIRVICVGPSHRWLCRCPRPMHFLISSAATPISQCMVTGYMAVHLNEFCCRNKVGPVWKNNCRGRSAFMGRVDPDAVVPDNYVCSVCRNALAGHERDRWIRCKPGRCYFPGYTAAEKYFERGYARMSVDGYARKTGRWSTEPSGSMMCDRSTQDGNTTRIIFKGYIRPRYAVEHATGVAIAGSPTHERQEEWTLREDHVEAVLNCKWQEALVPEGELNSDESGSTCQCLCDC